MFYPEEVPRGPGRKTRLKPTRKVQGTYLNSLRFKKENDWTKDNIDDELSENWTGQTIFIVDKQHCPITGRIRDDRELSHLTIEEFPGLVRLIETTDPHKSIRCSELLLSDSRIRLVITPTFTTVLTPASFFYEGIVFGQCHTVSR